MFPKTMRMAKVFSNKVQVLYYLVFSTHIFFFVIKEGLGPVAISFLRKIQNLSQLASVLPMERIRNEVTITGYQCAPSSSAAPNN